jgi:hypothetical protein
MPLGTMSRYNKTQMKLRYILIAAALSLLFGLVAYGRNGQTAQELAGEVVAADIASTPTETAVGQLRSYVSGHMGASVSVFLAGSYERARATATPNSDGQVYHAAQAACVSRTSAVNQAKCVQDYVAANSQAGSSTATAPELDKADYTQNYLAPTWSLDLAGLMLATSVLAWVAAAGIWFSRRRGFRR